MAVYLVERYLPGEPATELARVAHRAETTTAQLRAEGIPVRYMGSTLVPEEQTCFCLFDAPSDREVLAANDRAGLGYERIVSALVLTPVALSETTATTKEVELP